MDIQQVKEMAMEHGLSGYTDERAAFMAYCFNEGEKRGVPPTVIAMEIMREYDLRQNLGSVQQANNSGGIAPPSKPSWQL